MLALEQLPLLVAVLMLLKMIIVAWRGGVCRAELEAAKNERNKKQQKRAGRKNVAPPAAKAHHMTDQSDDINSALTWYIVPLCHLSLPLQRFL